MGLALLIVVMKALGLRHRRPPVGRRRALLDPDLRHQLRRRRRHRHPDGVPVRHQLGATSRGTPAASIGQTLAMEGLFAFFLESSFLGAARLRRAAPRRGAGTSWPRSRCSSAAGSPATSSSAPTPSCSIRSGHGVAADGTLVPRRLLGLPAEPVGGRPVRAHHGRPRGHGLLRGGGGGRLLRAPGAPPRPRAAVFLRVGVVAGLVVERAGRVPDRRPAGQARRRASAGGAGRDGGPLRERDRRRHRDHRPAQRAGAAARQPDRRPAGSSASSPTGRSTATSRA